MSFVLVFVFVLVHMLVVSSWKYINEITIQHAEINTSYNDLILAHYLKLSGKLTIWIAENNMQNAYVTHDRISRLMRDAIHL